MEVRKMLLSGNALGYKMNEGVRWFAGQARTAMLALRTTTTTTMGYDAEKRRGQWRQGRAKNAVGEGEGRVLML